jgi:hypothetical protein
VARDQGCGKPARTSSEFKDGPRGFEFQVGHKLVGGLIFKESLSVLCSTDTVVNTSGRGWRERRHKRESQHDVNG